MDPKSFQVVSQDDLLLFLLSPIQLLGYLVNGQPFKPHQSLDYLGAESPLITNCWFPASFDA